jgi:signal transduction histidine kinase
LIGLKSLMVNLLPQKIRALFGEMGWEEPLSKQKWWILLRWVLLGVVILTTLIGSHLIHLSIPISIVLAVCGVTILLNAFFHYYFFRRKDTPPESRTLERFTYVQFAADWVFITLTFHYTGGIASPLLFYFLFHVILSGVLLERWDPLLYVTLIALTITVLSLLEVGGYLPHVYSSSFISPDVQDNFFFVLMLLFFCNIVLYISGSFVVWMFRRSRQRIAKLVELQQKLEQANRELWLLNQVARDTNMTRGLYPRLAFICRSITSIMGLRGTAIRLLDERTNRQELVSAYGLSDDYINKGPVYADKSLAKALEGEPHFVLDATSDPSVQYPEENRKEGIGSMLAVPLKGRKKIIGTMRLYTTEKRTFTQNELDIIYGLAAQGAISIENAKSLDILEKQDRTKSEFIMLMTHELKGPLMAIQSLLEVMLKGYVGTLTEKQTELIGRSYRRIDSVMEVSTQLLDIYQWQSQRPEASWVPLSMKEQIHRALDLFKTSAQEKRLTLNTEVPELDLTIMATEEEMETILNNLITNAIKYTPEGGTVSLALSSADDRVVLAVKDTGIGIHFEDMPRIFEDFFRTNEAKKIDPYGRGIGLPFVKKVVETLGGTIEVESEKGKGTKFILSFPRKVPSTEVQGPKSMSHAAH